ncbi:MAG: SRPBCC family protein [Kordiimonadaceae bacterium]|nr:SRPBCC family protein [Kordiimonadaceae bacterium]
MIKFETIICVDVPIAQAWHEMARIDEVHLWVDALKSSRCSTPHNRGLGAVRVCELRNGVEVSEEFTHWDEGKAFTYRATGKGMPGMKWAENRWTFEAKGEQTLIRSNATLAMRWGMVGRLIEPLIWLMIKRDMPNIGASLKYFVENGNAFDGKTKSLPRAPSFC